MPELVVATKNKKKLREIRDLLKGSGLVISSCLDHPGAPRVIENAGTFEGNAIKKALNLARWTGSLTMGEDSGLCVEALGGKPGVYSSRFSGKPARRSGGNKSDAQNNLKLLRLMRGVPDSKRKAYYVCAVAIADKDGLVGVAEGRCSGRIAHEPKGTHGFGYDPLFVIPKYKKTFAQLGEKVKHRMSHRYRALEKAKKILFKYIERRRVS